MSKEMIISSSAHETRVAILEDDQVAEIFIERERSRGVVGNVYKGRVSKCCPACSRRSLTSASSATASSTSATSSLASRSSIVSKPTTNITVPVAQLPAGHSERRQSTQRRPQDARASR